MNKLIIVIIAVAVAIAAYFIYRPVSCDMQYNAIEAAMDEANHCERDTDCDVLMLGGRYVEFGCYHYINKDVDKQEFYEMMRIYSGKCSRMINKCGLAPNATCVEGKCVSVN